ncbi:hypothetical protein TWF281_004700 [Arthrobotrys megalospora]
MNPPSQPHYNPNYSPTNQIQPPYTPQVQPRSTTPHPQPYDTTERYTTTTTPPSYTYIRGTRYRGYRPDEIWYRNSSPRNNIYNRGNTNCNSATYYSTDETETPRNNQPLNIPSQYPTTTQETTAAERVQEKEEEEEEELEEGEIIEPPMIKGIPIPERVERIERWLDGVVEEVKVCKNGMHQAVLMHEHGSLMRY